MSTTVRNVRSAAAVDSDKCGTARGPSPTAMNDGMARGCALQSRMMRGRGASLTTLNDGTVRVRSLRARVPIRT